ncbi:MAG: DNA-binding response regulator, partial [Comamonadaceae bacterium]
RQGGVPVELSSREFGVLRILMEVSPRVLSRSQIETGLYNWEAALESNAIEVHVHHLRRKLGDGVIRTMRGVGYFMPAAPVAASA